jgi:hypothetical protein
MNESGQDGYGTFLAEFGDVPPGNDRPSGVRQRGAVARRLLWDRRRRVLVAAGVIAAAGGVTAALLVQSASHAPTALAAVTSALAKTSAESYSFSVNSAMRFNGREMSSDVVSGAFDPKHRLGTELLTTSYEHHQVMAQIRFIGTYVYTSVPPRAGLGTVGRPWDKAPVPSAGTEGMSQREVYGFVSDEPVSPAGLSGVLRAAGTVRDEGPASGPGWTGTRYAFTARYPGSRESVNGTVYVDRQGRARRLVTLTRQRRATTDRNLTFGDFDAPVSLTAPPVSQVEYTSKPYWGFFF